MPSRPSPRTSRCIRLTPTPMADGPRRSSCQNRRRRSARSSKLRATAANPSSRAARAPGSAEAPSRCAGGVIVSLMRMNRILELDLRNRRVRVQPGLMNLDLSRQVAPEGLFYAPDPSSQQISTIGGNIATNAGGPHCLSYGTTVNHVLGLEFVDDAGEVFATSIDDAGYDLTGGTRGQRRNAGPRDRPLGSGCSPSRKPCAFGLRRSTGWMRPRRPYRQSSLPASCRPRSR